MDRQGQRSGGPAGERAVPTGRTYDAVVLGGGAAGLSAAVVLGRCRRSVLVVDAGQPRNAPAAHSHGLFTRDGAPPAELIARGRAEVRDYGGEFLDDTAVAVEPAADGFSVRTARGHLVGARRLLLTTGLLDELPEVPGIAARWGRDVIHCPFCHGWEVRDQRTVLLARSPLDIHKAILVTQLTTDLTVVLDGGPGRADGDAGPEADGVLTAEERELLTAAGVPLLAGPVTDLDVADDRLTGIRLADGRAVPADVLYLTPRMTTRDTLLTKLGAETTSGPFGLVLATDPSGATSVPGVWAAGNVVDPGAQLVHAASAGYRAAQAMVASLALADLRSRLQPG